MKGKPIRFALVALLLLSAASSVLGQALGGTLAGVVKDPTEAVIPGATVTALDLATGREYKAATDTSGSFVMANLPNGFYRVSIESPGFAKYTVPRLQVLVSQTSTLTVKMELAKAGQEIVVTSEQNTVEVDSPEIKSTIERAQIMNLPLPTRNPMDLVRSLPGMATPVTSTDAFVHGLRGNATHLTQDGINVADNTVKTSAFFVLNAPTVDSTSEFNVSTGAIGADAGAGATQVSMRTQRGSNDFHGALFWYQRTNAFAANPWFNNAAGTPRPFQLQNRIGAQGGGPVSIPGIYDGKGRSWVFGLYEAFREPRSQPRTRSVMTSTARTGMYTYIPICDAGTVANNPDCPSGITAGQPIQINLLTIGTLGATINPATMTFYNNVVPTTGLTDSGCTSDNFNIRCFTWNIPGKSLNDRYVVRGDHQITKNHAIEFVYTRANFDTSPDFLNGNEPQFPGVQGGGQDSKRELYVGALTSSFGSNRTNEFRAGLTRAPVNFRLDEDYAETAGFMVDYSTVTDPTTLFANLPQGRNTPVRQIMDNFSWVKGRHTLRFGGEYQLILSNNYFFNQVVPRINIGASSTNPNNILAPSSSEIATCTTTAQCDFPGGISTGDLGRAQGIFNNITGMIFSVSQGFNHTSPSSGFVAGQPRLTTPTQATTAGYFTDSFKWRPNLTVQFGVRYEYQGVFDLRNQLILQPVGDTLQGLWGPTQVGSFFTPSGTPVQSDVLMDFAGGRNGKPIYGQDENNFAPFLGFAWDPWKDGKTSIRGGAAAHFTQDGFTVGNIAATGNTGLFVVKSTCNPAVPANCTSTGVAIGTLNLASAPKPAVPVSSFPVSQAANLRDARANLWVFEPNLRNPYVLEWSLSVQRELWKRTTVEVRYIGNHAVKQLRSYSLNELNLLNSPFTCITRAVGTLPLDNLGQTDPGLNCGTANGVSVASMLQEFKNAQNNLALCQANRTLCTGSATGTLRFNNAGVPGQVELPIFTALFNGVSASSGFQSSAFVTNLQQNAVGSLFNTVRSSASANTYLRNRNFNFPLNFFVANPWAESANLVSNAGWSNYHGLEVEVRRRFTTGLFFQANYTFSKVLTDVRFLTSQQESQNYKFLNNGKSDKNRAAFDVTHSVSANFIYSLPFGQGKWIGGNVSGAMNKLIGGWQIQGITRLQSGTPFNITSEGLTVGGIRQRLALGSLETTTASIRNMTADQLQKQIGVFYRPEGIYWLNPDSGLLNISATLNATTGLTSGTSKPIFCTRNAAGVLTTTTPCFEYAFAGENGNLPFFGLETGKFWNQDLSVIKRTSIPAVSEQFNFEIRFEMFNVFNHPNFGGLSTNLDNSNFGRLTSQVDTARGGGVTSRLMQWAIRLNW